jgi:hypothetical protein
LGNFLKKGEKGTGLFFIFKEMGAKEGNDLKSSLSPF